MTQTEFDEMHFDIKKALSPQQRRLMTELIKRNLASFAPNPVSPPPPTDIDGVEHTIHLFNVEAPVKQRPYRLSPLKQELQTASSDAAQSQDHSAVCVAVVITSRHH
jgi:hypothetical protein